MAADEKYHQLDVKINLVERDIEQLTKVDDKFEESCNKLNEVSINLAQMISLHEQRHEQHELVETELKEDIKELHSRITTVTRELHDRMDEVENNITNKIDALRRELLSHEQRDRERNKLGDVLREIDKYKFLILGGAIVVGWILGNINLSVLSSLMK